MRGEITWADEQRQQRRALARRSFKGAVLIVVVGVVLTFLGCACIQAKVTKQVHDMEMAEVRAELAQLKEEDLEPLQDEMSELRMNQEMLQGEVEGMAFQQALIQNAIVHLHPGVDRFQSFRIAKVICWTSDGYGFDPFLIVALIYHESKFDPEARGAAGERGLMQVMAFHCKDYGIKPNDLWDIETNIDVGSGVLDDCLYKHGDHLASALGCYNGSSPRDEYATKVNATYKRLLKEFDDDRRKWIIEWGIDPSSNKAGTGTDGKDEGSGAGAGKE